VTGYLKHTEVTFIFLHLPVDKTVKGKEKFLAEPWGPPWGLIYNSSATARRQQKLQDH